MDLSPFPSPLLKKDYSTEEENTLETNDVTQWKYEELPGREWSEDNVRDLQLSDVEGLYDWLPSIMQAESLTGHSKIRLALDLLNVEQSRVLRARIWDGLTICARVTPQSDFRDVVAIAWHLIELASSDDTSNPELCSIQDFVNDLRVFAEVKITDSLIVNLQTCALTRYETFTVSRALCSYHDIVFAGRLAVQLAGDADFVLRESGLNGISIIYSRSDCEPDALGALRLEFIQTLNEHRSDPHWYVRKTNDIALFFQGQYDAEFLSAKSGC